jgi:N-methylhydantoinase B
MSNRFDPITFQVLWSRCESIADEMSNTLVNTAFSSVVRDNHDYAIAFYDHEGRMLAQAQQSTPGQLGSMHRVMHDFLELHPAHTLHPGDVLITNDPWLGSGHTPDIYLATPIFRGDRVAGFAVNSAHHMDIGGRMASPDTREVFEEGVIIPICKLYDAGHPNDTLIRLLERNVRLPQMLLGDLRAQMAANHTGVHSVLRFMDDAGLDTLTDLSRAVIAHTERAMRAAIADLPDGCYRHRIDLEDTDRAGEPLAIAIAVSVDGDRMDIDFDGTSPQVDLPINSVYNMSQAYTLFAVKCVAHPHIPNNIGSSLPVSVRIPARSLLNPEFPAPVMHRTAIAHYCVEAVFCALAHAVPDRVLAPGGCYPLWIERFGGRTRDGRRFVVAFNAQGGQGARHGGDGVSTTIFPANVGSTSVELMEAEAPLLCERKALAPDSAGAGEFRGGFGQDVVVRNVSGGEVSTAFVGGRFRRGAAGMRGGAAGRIGCIRVDGGEPITRRHGGVLADGQSVTFSYPGGGGFGDPLLRDPERVLSDVAQGLVSVHGAQRDYGVVIRDGTVDAQATAARRKNQKGTQSF